MARERGLGLSSVLPTAGYPWSVIAGSKVADPATDDVSNIFSNLPAVDDGRVWTDKTVRTLGGQLTLKLHYQPCLKACQRARAIRFLRIRSLRLTFLAL